MRTFNLNAYYYNIVAIICNSSLGLSQKLVANVQVVGLIHINHNYQLMCLLITV